MNETGCSHRDCFKNKQPVPVAPSGASALLSPLSKPNAPTVRAEGMVGSLPWKRTAGFLLENDCSPTAIKTIQLIPATTVWNLLIFNGGNYKNETEPFVFCLLTILHQNRNSLALPEQVSAPSPRRWSLSLALSLSCLESDSKTRPFWGWKSGQATGCICHVTRAPAPGPDSELVSRSSSNLRHHKKAEAVLKHDERFAKDPLFSPAYISFS